MDAIERYKAKKTAYKSVWTPPTMESFRQRFTVLSFDQSLSKTGWIRLLVAGGMVVIDDRGTIKTSSDASGWHGNFAQARQVRLGVSAIHDRITSRGFPDAIVLEMPSVGGHRTDSSMLAAYEIDDYCNMYLSRPKLVSIQRSRSLLGGPNARNNKKAGHKALERYIPGSIQRSWNEHQRDAALNGLAHLYEINQENPQ